MMRRTNICCLFLLAMGISVGVKGDAMGKDYEPAVHWLEDYQTALEAWPFDLAKELGAG